MPDRDDYYERQDFYRQQDRAYENFRDDLEYERRKRASEVERGHDALRDGDTLGAIRGLGGVDAALEYANALNTPSSSEPGSIYTLLQLNLHEGGQDDEPPTSFPYLSELPQSQTRFIFIQPVVENPWLASEMDVTLSIDIGLFQQQLTRTDSRFTIYPEWRTFMCWFRFGWDVPGLWMPGLYDIVCLVDGVQVGGHMITITED